MLKAEDGNGGDTGHAMKCCEKRWTFPATLAALLGITLALASCGGGGAQPSNPSTPVTLVSIAVSPANPTIAINTTEQFKATGTYSDGSTQDLTSVATWSSSNAAVATIGNSGGTYGLATGTNPGTSTISAASGSQSGATVLTVSSASLVSIVVDPQAASILIGATQAFSATGTFSDGSMQTITDSVTWSSSSSAVATISNNAGTQGIATGISAGTTTVTAGSGSVSANASLTVGVPTLVSISVTPANPTIALGMTQQFTATGTYSDNSTQNITTSVTWSSGTKSVATISNTAGSQGLATSVAAGAATISATSGAISASTTLTVSSATLVSISVSPLVPTIALGTTQQFTATGTYSDNTTQNITTSVTWTSGTKSVATISNTAGTQGLATSVAEGSTTITAASGSVNASTTLTVSAATLVSIALSPPSPTIAVGSTQQFTATGTYSDASTQNITTSVNWTSSAPGVATISNSPGKQGLATGAGAGTSTITATLGVTGSTTLTVTQSSSTQTWTLHGPPGRSSHSAVYDPTSNQMIIFGGQSTTGQDLNDVWLGITASTQDDRFTAETPSGTAPQGRYGHVAMYDSVHNRMMIFGGGTAAPACLNDSWILNGANGQGGTPNWIAATPSGTLPGARIYAGGAYDSNTNSLIIFGGNNCSTGYFGDVWVLSNANGESGTAAWTQLTPSGSAPQSRESASVVYDSTNNILMMYGGDAGGSPFGDVWILSPANGSGGTPAWTQLSPSGTAPTARTGQTAIYDSSNDRMTIFGGINSGTTLTDTWVLTSANGIGGTPTWSQIATQGTAPSLAYHTAVYDSSSDNMYVFGGTSSEDKLQTDDHAFTLSGANGISSNGEKWVLGGPPVRYGQSAFYDSALNDLFVFGGQHASSNINFNDYWQQSGALGSVNLQWTTVSTNGSRPSGRFGHTGLYDSGSNRMMVFGGATGFPAPCANDYYILEQADNQDGTPTWVSISTATAPAARTLQASVYDSGTNTIIIFGGYNCASTYYNDVWILTDANDESGQPNWTQLQPTGTPPSAREASSAIYDSTTNSLVIYGGDAGGNPFGDIWILSHANGSGGTPAWTQLDPSNSGPSARSGHTATYDSVNNLMTIYGGYDGTNVIGDVWVLSGANGQAGAASWTQLTSGQVRRFHSSEYDPASNQMITYGGATGVTSQVPTSDIYTLTDANGLP